MSKKIRIEGNQMLVVTSEQMREIERRAIEEFSIPSIILMENAAIAVTMACMKRLNGCGKPRVAIFCGKGNNGGDGFAVARLLHGKNVIVNVFFIGNADEVTGDARTNLQIIRKLGINITVVCDEGMWPDVCKTLEKSNLIVDAIFGTGLSSEVKGIYRLAIEAINGCGCPVVSIDLPSGLNADDGKIMGAAVRANETVTLGMAKQGLYLYPGADIVGKITTAPIGIPLSVSTQKTFIMNDREFFDLLPTRPAIGNKGTFGQVYVLAGCDEMPGAAVLAAEAAYKAGCGLVKAYVTRHVAGVLQGRLIEATTCILPDVNGFLSAQGLPCTKELNKARAVLLGPGLGNNEYVRGFVLHVLTRVETTVVIDADALNVIANDTSVLNKLKAKGVVTPHPGEMSRLAGLKVEQIVSNPIQVASDFAMRRGVVTVLKGARTIVADPDGTIYINVTGNSALAKAGSGDVLTGLIGAFVAQGKDAFTACVLAVYLHGMAGENAAKTLSDYGVNASDTVAAVPKVLLRHAVLPSALV